MKLFEFVKHQVEVDSLVRGIINDMSACCCMRIVKLELRGDICDRNSGEKQGLDVLIYCGFRAAHLSWHNKARG